METEEDKNEFEQRLKEAKMSCIRCCGTCFHRMKSHGSGVVDCIELHLKNIPLLFCCGNWKYGLGVEISDLYEDMDLKKLDEARNRGKVVFPCPNCQHRIYNAQQPTINGFEAWGCQKDCGMKTVMDFINVPQCNKFKEGDSNIMWS